jgi:hypothetical protein
MAIVFVITGVLGLASYAAARPGYRRLAARIEQS